MEHTGFPSDETLAAYIDGRLDAETRRRVTEHIADCAECWADYMTGIEALDDPTLIAEAEPAANVVRPRFGWYRSVATVATVAAAGVVGFVAIGPARDFFAARNVPETLMSAAKHRPTEARLSSAPYKETYNPRGTPDEEKDAALISAIIDVRNKAGDRQSAGARHLRGYADIFDRNYDDAIDELRAAGEKKQDADILSDLSAAYLARGKDDDYAKALDAASRARKTNAASREAAFNYALALQRLKRDDEAKKAWQDYLALDSTSPWAQEAKEHLETLNELTAPAHK